MILHLVHRFCEVPKIHSCISWRKFEHQYNSNKEKYSLESLQFLVTMNKCPAIKRMTENVVIY